MMLRGSEKWTFSQENSQLGLATARDVMNGNEGSERKSQKENSLPGKRSLRNEQLSCAASECGLEERADGLGQPSLLLVTCLLFLSLQLWSTVSPYRIKWTASYWNCLCSNCTSWPTTLAITTLLAELLMSCCYCWTVNRTSKCLIVSHRNRSTLVWTIYSRDYDCNH